jgi:hypothetical protein
MVKCEYRGALSPITDVREACLALFLVTTKRRRKDVPFVKP